MDKKERVGVVILPNQLFEKHPGLQKNVHVYLVEHDRYFKAFKFHKQKLIFHRASMKAYENYLKKKKYKITYLDSKNGKKLYSTLAKDKINKLILADPADHTVHKEFASNLKKKKIEFECIENPAFLTPLSYIQKKYGKKKSFRMHSFYQDQRKRLDILMRAGKPIGDKWSFDDKNREPLPENIKIPKLSSARTSAYVTAAKKYVKKSWSKNPGNTDQFIYPVTHAAAKKWLSAFLSKRLKSFGPYQDAILDGEPFLFHSVLSPLLNAGLLTPDFVVEKTVAYYKKHKTPINSVEGFIRQIIGWREYVRMVYHVAGKKEASSNFFGARKKLPKSFWSGSTKVEPIDTTINNILDYAYAHHIERLMVLGNFMLLSSYSPKAVYSWFMELFIDAYDWVMVPNVFGMSQYADGGIMSTKPYISSSAYILKMSNYQKGEWCEKWDKLFWQFIKKHKAKLKKIPRMGLLLNAYAKKKK